MHLERGNLAQNEGKDPLTLGKMAFLGLFKEQTNKQTKQTTPQKGKVR